MNLFRISMKNYSLRAVSDLCTDRFRELADSLGGVACEDASPFVYLRDPRDLADVTMPVVELLILLGAVLAFRHAWVLRRDTGDATNLGVCLAAVAYVLVLEPPLYFPALFGIDDYVSAVFVHNEFTVGLLYHRLPLYILLLYPALVYLAWVLVQRLGVLERHGRVRGAVIASVCVGAVHQGFYSIFDQFGPDHLWWAWDTDTRTNAILVGDVPMSSTVNFALVMPTAFALACFLLLGRRVRPTTGSVVLPAIGIGFLTPLLSIPGQLPVTYLDLVDAPSYDAVRVVLWLMLVAATAVLVRELVAAWRAPTVREPGLRGAYPTAYLALWLATFAILAVVTPPAGVVAYLVPCYALSLAVLVTVARSPVGGVPRTRARPGGGRGDRVVGRAPIGG
ncbi:hypothetical protein SAMN05216561_105161 [Nocardioides psychrotolerans]|uniref:Uncharacterized protein n=2 Tax=Nocardioides psychrotolerans TaxID=1005945 RepID=A0A1I3FUT2_9ACTN|nr:hypothetical protein SAMN05216561_105161 [Nocardioides psychrotolerans]